MKRMTGIAVGCLICLPAWGQSLGEAIAHTIKTNPDILTNANNRLAREGEITQAKSGYLPSIDLNAGYGFEEANNRSTRGTGCLKANIPDPPDRGTSRFNIRHNNDRCNSVDMERTELGATVRQMVFDGMKTYHDTRRTKAAVAAAAYNVFGTAESVALDAAEAYLNVLREQELVQLAKDNVEVHERTMDQIKLRSDMGVGRKADDDQARARLALARTNLLSEEGNLNDAISHYQRIMGVLPDSPARPEDPRGKLPADMDTAIKLAMENHPQLKSADADIEETDAQHDMAYAPFFPRVDIELSATSYSNLNGVTGYNNDYQAMLRMKYNILAGGKDMGRLEQTAHQINEAKEIRNHTYRQVVESMRFSWIAFQTKTNQLGYFKEHMEDTEKTHKAYQQQFNLGERTLLDLLDTANELFTARSSYTNASFDELFAMYRVLAAMGDLNNALGVKLPEETIPVEIDGSIL
jgi:adhesin transport system outer membrane protein